MLQGAHIRIQRCSATGAKTLPQSWITTMSTASGHLAGSDQIGEHRTKSVPDWRADRGLLPPSWLPTLIVAAVATPAHQTNLDDPEWDFALLHESAQLAVLVSDLGPAKNPDVKKKEGTKHAITDLSPVAILPTVLLEQAGCYSVIVTGFAGHRFSSAQSPESNIQPFLSDMITITSKREKEALSVTRVKGCTQIAMPHRMELR